MTISMVALPMIEEQERVRKEEGEQAAKECAHGQVGSVLRSTSGAIGGATIGTAILPGIGTAVGFFVGGLFGAIRGGNDKSTADNVRSAASYVRSLPR